MTTPKSSDDYPDVVIATRADCRIAVENALARIGCTFDELKAMRDSGHYETIKHRLVWCAIGDLYGADLSD